MLSDRIESNDFDLSITQDTISIAKDTPVVTLSLNCSNVSGKSFILYEFNGSILMPPYEQDNFCIKEVAAGLALFIYKESGKQKFPETYISDSIDYTPMPRERVEFLLRESRVEFAKGTCVFKPSDRRDFKKEIDLTSYQLERGTYYLQLVYFSGEYITNYVDPDQIAKDKRTHNANVYQGCIKSNQVKLTVN
ncbi:MAG: hypothetical protein EBR30_29965 [Cytophagia bacterium]|nr:hypothetical protein [Cytophagia bacterium]